MQYDVYCFYSILILIRYTHFVMAFRWISGDCKACIPNPTNYATQ